MRIEALIPIKYALGITVNDPPLKKSRIRETKNLSTDADSRIDTILERLRDLSKKKLRKN